MHERHVPEVCGGMTEFIILLSIIWIICGILTYGGYIAYFQGYYPTLAKEDCQKDKRWALFFAICGPIGLFAGWVVHGYKHGFRFKCLYN